MPLRSLCDVLCAGDRSIGSVASMADGVEALRREREYWKGAARNMRCEFTMQRAACSVARTTCSVHHGACITQRGSMCRLHTADSMQHSADAFSFAARCLALEEKVHKPSLREHVRPSPLHARAVPPLGHWHKRTASRVIGMGAPRPSCNTAPGLGWAVANPGRL